MKSLSIILTLFFFTSNLFAQIDTIYTKKGNIYACTIIELDDEKIQTIDATSSKLRVYLFLVESVKFDSFGEIYNQNDGYTIDIETLEPALEWRLEQLEKEKELEELKEESDEAEIAETKSNSKDAPKDFIRKDEGKPKFSFGVFYVPHAMERKVFYFEEYIPNYSVIEGYSSQIESQLSYHLQDRLFVICNVGFNSATIKNTTIEKMNYFNPPNENKYGYELETSLKLLTIELGFKYYFMNLFSNHVSTYVQLGVGKTLAWGDYNYNNLFEEDIPYYSQDNRSEFLEDLNSPFLLQVGFGAEYFFNENLSLHSSIRIYYSSTSAKYETVFKDDYSLRINSNEQERTDILTKVGLGLNFYF